MAACAACAQQAQAPQPVATVAVEGLSLSGAMSVVNGRATIANNGEIIAGPKTAEIKLVRGGTVALCASTILHIAKDASASTEGRPDNAGLMFSLERGALETHYTPGAYSDVVLTPDLRVLISGPGTADLKMRVNRQGDTCVDNAGENAPYVVASSLMEGGAYRVRPGQRVLFVHGSLGQVVDNEREPCGCPPAAPNAVASGTQSLAAANNPFPLAVSEGLQPPPPPPSTPEVPPGVAHAQVMATLSSNTPPGPAPPPPSTPPSQPPAKRGGFFRAIGRFFAKVFGAS